MVSYTRGLVALLVAACSNQSAPPASGSAGDVGYAASGGAMNGAGGQVDDVALSATPIGCQ